MENLETPKCQEAENISSKAKRPHSNMFAIMGLTIQDHGSALLKGLKHMFLCCGLPLGLGALKEFFNQRIKKVLPEICERRYYWNSTLGNEQNTCIISRFLQLTAETCVRARMHLSRNYTAFSRCPAADQCFGHELANSIASHRTWPHLVLKLDANWLGRAVRQNCFRTMASIKGSWHVQPWMRTHAHTHTHT